MHFSITKSTTELVFHFGMNTRPRNLLQRRWFSITTSISKWLMRFSEFTKSHLPLQKFNIQVSTTSTASTSLNRIYQVKNAFFNNKTNNWIVVAVCINTRPPKLLQRRWFSITTSISMWLMRFKNFTKLHLPLQKFRILVWTTSTASTSLNRINHFKNTFFNNKINNWIVVAVTHEY